MASIVIYLLAWEALVQWFWLDFLGSLFHELWVQGLTGLRFMKSQIWLFGLNVFGLGFHGLGFFSLLILGSYGFIHWIEIFCLTLYVQKSSNLAAHKCRQWTPLFAAHLLISKWDLPRIKRQSSETIDHSQIRRKINVPQSRTHIVK